MTTPSDQQAVRPSARWLTALTSASNDLRRLLDGLDDNDLTRPSYADGWSIAQVLSHLGSGSEISAELVRRGLAGSNRGPQREQLLPIWDRWNAMGPTEQRDEWSKADLAHIELLTSITAEQEQTLLVPYFAGPMDLATYLGYRLSEHALHGWDIAVTLDPRASVGQLELVWERIDLIASRFHDSDTRSGLAPRRVALHHDGRADLLEILDEIHVRPYDDTDGRADGSVSATTDVLTRLIYGRLRDSDQVDITGPVARPDLARLFQGF